MCGVFLETQHVLSYVGCEGTSTHSLVLCDSKLDPGLFTFALKVKTTCFYVISVRAKDYKVGIIMSVAT